MLLLLSSVKMPGSLLAFSMRPKQEKSFVRQVINIFMNIYEYYELAVTIETKILIRTSPFSINL